MIAHETIPWCWRVNGLPELGRLISINSPAIVFCANIADMRDAIFAMIGAQIDPVIVPITANVSRNPQILSEAMAASRVKHGRAVIMNKALVTGWFSATPRCVVIWNGSRFTEQEISQAHGRIRHAMVGYSRTFIYETEL